MADAPQLIQYLRNCYEADNRESGIANLLSDKYRHVAFLSGTEDLLRGVLDRVPIDRELGIAAQKEADLYRKEKRLVYCAFPLVGRLTGNRQLPSRLCAPLLFWPASVVAEGPVAQLQIDLSQQRVNFPVLSALAGEAEPSRSIVENLLGQIPQAPFRAEDLHCLTALIMDVLPGIECLELAAYPRLVDEGHVRRVLKAADEGDGGLVCLPACALALVPNSPQTRGVLFELAELAQQPLSKPVQLLLGQPATGRARRPLTAAHVPVVLSHAQQRVLASAASQDLTLVIGPPGTGKSYTIAALALDHLARGESVLIASRMNHAVDVVAGKMESLLGSTPCIIRGGRKEYLRELKKFLGEILHGIMPDGLVEERELRHTKRSLATWSRQVAQLEQALQTQGRREEQWGCDSAAALPDRLLSRTWRRWRIGYLDWQLKSHRPLWDLTERYQHALEERNRTAKKLIRALVTRRLEQMSQHHRTDLSKFLQAIRARSDGKQAQLFSEIRLDVLFGTFPVWIVALDEVSEVLPLRSELFDVAVIDEATQCDIASCVPVLQRARRAVIVGDPNQLRHVSFLSDQRQQVIAERHTLDAQQAQQFHYRQKSILDLSSEMIASQQQVIFLDEHFRSMPQIIRFSNDEFYRGQLNVMTQRPETAQQRCVELRRVPGGRKARGLNREEARALVDEVLRRVQAEADVPPCVCHSLGILSPFRDQVDQISSLLQKELTLEDLAKHDVLVGTAHTFQGEERDVMLLSLVVDPETHFASFQFLCNPNVFNVSITRARSEQIVFCSLGPEDIRGDTLLRRYLTAIARGPQPEARASEGMHDAFLREVRQELGRQGYRTWSAYPVAGLQIDLVAERSGRTLGLDLIGYPGQFAGALALERYRMFQRAGLTLFPLSYRAWTRDRTACLAAIQAWHERGSPP